MTGLRWTGEMAHRGDFLIDLGRVGALAVGILGAKHFEYAHTEGVYVDELVVILFVELRCHELRRPWNKEQQQRFRTRAPPPLDSFVFGAPTVIGPSRQEGHM